jgi:ribosomal protein S18 acetylase RimI-like enzyme
VTEIVFRVGELTPTERDIVYAGFAEHGRERDAPAYAPTRIAWRASSDDHALVGVLTANVLWDWLYIDELWVDASQRGTGLGKRLMEHAEAHAAGASLTGLWLWTQSWQAADFYTHLGFEKFAEFPDFPRGHSRIGFRKMLGGTMSPLR